MLRPEVPLNIDADTRLLALPRGVLCPVKHFLSRLMLSLLSSLFVLLSYLLFFQTSVSPLISPLSLSSLFPHSPPLFPLSPLSHIPILSLLSLFSPSPRLSILSLSFLSFPPLSSFSSLSIILSPLSSQGIHSRQLLYRLSLVSPLSLSPISHLSFLYHSFLFFFSGLSPLTSFSSLSRTN